MFRLIIWLLLLYIGIKVIKSLTTPKQQRPATPAGEETVKDPVCGIYLDKADAVVGTLDGKRHYFCSMDCLNRFRDQLDHLQHP